MAELLRNGGQELTELIGYQSYDALGTVLIGEIILLWVKDIWVGGARLRWWVGVGVMCGYRFNGLPLEQPQNDLWGRRDVVGLTCIRWIEISACAYFRFLVGRWGGGA